MKHERRKIHTRVNDDFVKAPSQALISRSQLNELG